MVIQWRFEVDHCLVLCFFFWYPRLQGVQNNVNSYQRHAMENINRATSIVYHLIRRQGEFYAYHPPVIQQDLASAL